MTVMGSAVSVLLHVVFVRNAKIPKYTKTAWTYFSTKAEARSWQSRALQFLYFETLIFCSCKECQNTKIPKLHGPIFPQRIRPGHGSHGLCSFCTLIFRFCKEYQNIKTAWTYFFHSGWGQVMGSTSTVLVLLYIVVAQRKPKFQNCFECMYTRYLKQLQNTIYNG